MPVPDAVPYDGTPAAHVEDTPDTPTIETLVNHLNEAFPRDDRPWAAGDTLKNVIVMLVHPDGTREPLAIGLPGDRDVDEKRLEAQVHPAEVQAFDEAAFAANPALVKGYIGPRALGEEGDAKVRYLLDPRIVEGTRWVTGANEAGKHVVDLVAGRDFTADGTIEAAEIRAGDVCPSCGEGVLETARGIEMGHIFALGRKFADAPGQHVIDLVAGRDFAADGTIEAAEVRPGDPCPTCDHTLSSARGIEMGHVFQLGTKYAEALDLKVLDQNGKLTTVVMGSYGVGVSRAVACVVEGNYDDAGIIWPRELSPADVHIVAAGKDEPLFAAAEALARELEVQGLTCIVDDRRGVSPGVKFKDSELIGVPTIVVVGRGLAEGRVEIKDRRSGERREVALDSAVESVLAEVRGS